MRLEFKKYLFLAMAIVGALCAHGQERKYKELFPVGMKLAPSAIHMGFGIVKMWAPLGGLTEFGWENGDSTYTSVNTAHGGYGLYLEGGYSHFYKDNPLLDNLDLTISFKQQKGEQNHESVLVWRRASDELDTVSLAGSGYFDQTSLSLSVTGNQHIQLTDKKYYIFGYGVDFNYRVFDSSTHTQDRGLQRNHLPSRFVANVHLRFGYSFYWKSMILMTPTIEVPIAGTEGFLTTKYYTSNYIPTIFSLRFTWLNRPKSFGCPSIKPTRGEKAKKRDYLQELFHPDNSRSPVPSQDGTKGQDGN